jgi:hypothetical protein
MFAAVVPTMLASSAGALVTEPAFAKREKTPWWCEFHGRVLPWNVFRTTKSLNLWAD